MTIKDAIKVVCEHNGWTYEGSFMRTHPAVPANCNYGGFTGGHRERRYEFSKDGQTIDFATFQVKSRARAIQRMMSGDKWTI